MKIFLMLVSFLVSAFSLQVWAAPQKSDQLIIVLPADVKADYETYIAGRDPLTMTNYTGNGARRDVVEVVLVQQALKFGGIDSPVRFITADSHARIIKQVLAGRAVLAGNSIWLDLLTSSEELLYVSQPIIESGQFEAGLYTIESNKTALKAKGMDEIRSLIAVSSKAWIIDWQTLNAMKMRKLINTVKWSSMVKMVNIGRADFLLAPFQPTPDMSFDPEGVKLIPIPNLKIGLQGSRHFAISKRHPQGKAVAEALDRGIAIMKERGLVNQAYQDSGFFNTKVKDWQKLL
ncbi:hypothetical protein K6Y31_08950 [Motilimonas cestriensis]|uniref:Solute-binding protein family 3/N-terminal domain-containing protein n=1 Tax=Motilimonas cestriensis TaxID=2742685 RepID=A0ABS8WA10_9GAMM|nr:hypothetical protein [Motilimonas cestriensis]MCE2594942.1 hypothetical protein [Motilimonas cestriensis]